MLLLLSADFFHKKLFQKNLSGTLSECYKVWIQIRIDILSVLIWVQTVFKGYQQTKMSLIAKKEVSLQGNDKKVTKHNMT